jgi:hypothetical protein
LSEEFRVSGFGKREYIVEGRKHRFDIVGLFFKKGLNLQRPFIFFGLFSKISKRFSGIGDLVRNLVRKGFLGRRL